MAARRSLPKRSKTCLLRHPAVIYAALVSMEDELMGEKSCAYLVVKEPLRAVQVRRFLREQGIAEFKLPDRVECVDSLSADGGRESRIKNNYVSGWRHARQPEGENTMAIPKLQAYALPESHDIPKNKVDWAFEPQRAALLIHDMQDYFVSFWVRNCPMMAQ
ncbi:enterobactin synthetase component E [includes: 2,3-dihydroxybenzoate-AMP ligase; S-dihydroxybenzoyltransferase] [Escherichia coli]|nr:enterobactin synthetase component E [includes: 2,3-dihydroxybenzoate-AMP ligase; S-dihydroxybenzoyltransferase] [Escherichia coli]